MKFNSVDLVLMKKHFSDEEITIIETKWDIFSDGFRFSTCTNKQLVNEAKMVLECSKLSKRS